jgi:hypothetical protein
MNNVREDINEDDEQGGFVLINSFYWDVDGDAAELSSPTDAMVADAILLLNGTNQGMTTVLEKEMMNNI